MEEFAPGSENVHQKWKNGSKYIKDTLSTLEVKYRLFVIPSRQVVGSTAWGGEVPQSDLDLVTWPSFHSDGFPLMAMNHEYKGKLKIPILLKWLASIELKSQFRQDSQCWTYSSYLAHMVHHLAWAGRSLWRPHRTLTHLRWLFWELVEIETVQDNRNATVQDRIHLIFGWFCLILFFNLIVASPPIASHQNGSRVFGPPLTKLQQNPAQPFRRWYCFNPWKRSWKVRQRCHGQSLWDSMSMRRSTAIAPL